MKSQKLMGLQILIFSCLFASISSYAASKEFTLKVTPIFKQDHHVANPFFTPPFIGIQNNVLVITTQKPIGGGPGEIKTYDLPTLFSRETTVGATAGNFGLAVSESGWSAACIDVGQTIAFFDARDLSKVYRIEFDPEVEMTSCFGMSLEIVPGERFPRIWTGSTGDRRIILIKPNPDWFENSSTHYAVEKDFQLISGPTYVQTVNDFIFTANALVNPFSSVPLVISKTDGHPLVGDLAGNNPPDSFLKREYWPFSYPDPQSDSVFYIRYAKDQEPSLLALSSSQPNIDTRREYVLHKMQMPTSVKRYKNCLLVLSETSANRYPEWNIYNYPNQSSLPVLELATGEYVNDNLKASRRQIVDDAGNVYLTNEYTVSQVSGLFDGLECAQGYKAGLTR